MGTRGVEGQKSPLREVAGYFHYSFNRGLLSFECPVLPGDYPAEILGVAFHRVSDLFAGNCLGFQQRWVDDVYLNVDRYCAVEISRIRSFKPESTSLRWG
jgi:hypothetical protein